MNDPVRDRKAKRFDLHRKQGGRCYYCTRAIALEKSTLDHKTPRSQGGADTYDNLVVACFPCNNAKGSWTEAEFRLVLKAITSSAASG